MRIQSGQINLDFQNGHIYQENFNFPLTTFLVHQRNFEQLEEGKSKFYDSITKKDTQERQ